jgi:hypothetical protein
MDLSRGDALVFVFEMLKLDDALVPDGKKKVVEVLYPAWIATFQIDKFCEVRLGVDSVHNLKGFQQALIVLVYLHDGAAFYIVPVVAFLFVVDIEIEKIGYVSDIALQCADRIAADNLLSPDMWPGSAPVF